MAQTKFEQIAGTGTTLYALDADGRVWQYDGSGGGIWRALPEKRAGMEKGSG